MPAHCCFLSADLCARASTDFYTHVSSTGRHTMPAVLTSYWRVYRPMRAGTELSYGGTSWRKTGSFLSRRYQPTSLHTHLSVLLA
eukprot:1049455-Rhodomonas_salina.3